jgi:2-keto-4-pentenoate hydratase/2-oxohepta-3-ene-1,7-dioic acid hydratase in catechol pathway
MKIVRAATDFGPAWGAVEGEDVLHLPDGPFGALETGYSLGRLDELPLVAPATPSKIVCVGRNYAAHAAEHGADVPSEPLLFLKPPSSVIPPGAEIVLPEMSARVEHECALPLIIGRRCRGVPEELAWEHVLGITCGNDVTVEVERVGKLTNPVV